MTSGDVERSSADQATEQGIVDKIEEEGASEVGPSSADAGSSPVEDGPSSTDAGPSSADASADSPHEGAVADSGAESAAGHGGDEKKEVNGVEVGRSQAAGYTQAIGAEYFNITDAEAWPVAGLLVLLDGVHQPVRAELQFYEDLPVEIEEAAVRQARSILQKKYTGTEPLPMRFVLAIQAPEVMDVPLPPPGARPRAAGSKSRTPLVLGIAGAIAIIALIWLGVTFFGSADGEAVAEAPTSESTVQVVNASGEAVSEEIGGAPAATALPDLPASRNARTDVDIGVRVRILPGLILTLRSEAGPTAGQEIGFMEEEEEATVIGGPERTRGETDTIVWWFVRLDDGTEAWAAANTSDQTLLEPVP